MKQRARLKPRVHIELTSLVDVIFILLIFFIFSYKRIDVQQQSIALPDAKQGQKFNLAKENTINITMHKDGRLLIEKEQVLLSDISKVLKQYLAQQKSTNIVINAESDISLQSLVSVMDEIKSSGFSKNPYVKTVSKVK